MNPRELMTLVINDSTELIENAIMLNDLYLELPLIIEAEHEAISGRNFAKIDEIGKSKSEVGDKIDSAFLEHKQHLDSIDRHHFSLFDSRWNGKKGVFSSVEMLKTIESSMSDGELETAVLSRNIEKLDDALTKFRKNFEEIQPELEKNRVVIEKMIKSQQESYRFWTEIAKEESSSYDASGSRKKRTQSHNSLLNVRA